MKEASGELSMTAVAVVAIAAIGVVFTTLIWPSIKSNITRSTKCTQAFSCNCTSGAKMCSCLYCQDDNCTNPQSVQCPNKDTN
ncbi:MAG: hypothetical protein Q4C44_00945 [bacterium]|nr:hypothetical protein [bacterium]